MSMYALMHGMNQDADFLLGLIGLTRENVGRFRDAWVTENGEIAVYTRNGGGNRECCHADNPKWGSEDCGGESYQVEVDEIVEVTEAEAKECCYELLNIYCGNKRRAKTGKRIMETRWTCPEPNSEKCSCTGCTMTERLPRHPLYVRDGDDDFDCTYNTAYFRVPDELKPLIAGLEQKRDMDEEWLRALDALKAGAKPRVEHALRPIFEAMRGVLNP